MDSIREDSGSVKLVDKYGATEQDWLDYAEFRGGEAAGVEADRRDTMEKIRREKVNAARSAACTIEGIAGALEDGGRSRTALRLWAAAADIRAVLDLIPA